MGKFTVYMATAWDGSGNVSESANLGVQEIAEAGDGPDPVDVAEVLNESEIFDDEILAEFLIPKKLPGGWGWVVRSKQQFEEGDEEMDAALLVNEMDGDE